MGCRPDQDTHRGGRKVLGHFGNPAAGDTILRTAICRRGGGRCDRRTSRARFPPLPPDAAVQRQPAAGLLAGDSVQEEELHRRERPVALLPAAGDPLLGEPLGPGGILLVLLWEGGAASWDEAFGELVRRTLALEAVHAAAAATLWLACESSAEPEATLGQLEGLVMGGRGLAARGWRWGVESSQPLFSLSRRYVMAHLLLRYEPPA